MTTGGTRQRLYLCAGAREGACDLPRVDASRVDGAVVEQLHNLGIDFEAWERELTHGAERARAAAEAELGERLKSLEKLTRAVGKLEAQLIDDLGGEDQGDPALADALRRAAAERDEAKRRADELRAVIDAEPDKDAMLDAQLLLQRILRDETAPVNERLKRLFAEVRVDVHDEMIGVLPVLLPHLIEVHGGRPDTIALIEGDSYEARLDPSRSADSPVLLVVPPPVRGLRVPLSGSGKDACVARLQICAFAAKEVSGPNSRTRSEWDELRSSASRVVTLPRSRRKAGATATVIPARLASSEGRASRPGLGTCLPRASALG